MSLFFCYISHTTFFTFFKFKRLHDNFIKTLRLIMSCVGTRKNILKIVGKIFAR